MATMKKGNAKTKKGTATKKVLDTKNVKDTVKKIVESKREIKYNYPTKIVGQTERKTWRQKVRNKIRKFERDLADMSKNKSKGITKVRLEYKRYRKEVLLVP